MAIAKTFLIISIFVGVIAVYLYRTVDEESRKEYILYAATEYRYSLSILNKWAPFLHLNGLQRSLENAIAKYTFNHLNKSGLIVGVRKFDGVEVILFDVLHHEKKRPAIVYIHGGGWSMMSPWSYSEMTADLARRLKTLVVSVDYRKAPEHAYPAAFDDVLTAVNYLFINAMILDVDPGRVVLMGDSAGGNLAVAVAYHLSTQRRRNPHAHVPKIVVPLCPVLQIADMQLPSFRDNVNDVVLRKKHLLIYICNYAFGEMPRSQLSECVDALGSNGHIDEATAGIVSGNMDWTKFLSGKGYDNRPKSQYHHKPSKVARRLSQLALEPTFSPLSALNDTEIRLLPPMYIFGASKDPLRDEAKLLAARLTSVGNLVTYKEVNYYHDPFFLSTIKLSKGIEAMDQLEAIFKHNAIL